MIKTSQNWALEFSKNNHMDKKIVSESIIKGAVEVCKVHHAFCQRTPLNRMSVSGKRLD